MSAGVGSRRLSRRAAAPAAALELDGAGTGGPGSGGPDDPSSEALLAALELGGDELDPDAAADARRALDRAVGRLRAGTGASVVALAGATGSGKSSLVNALAGLDVTTVGVRRPTTSDVTACVWGDVPEALLDWLDVPRRHRTERVSALDADTQAPLEGLVLLDLPDHDSTHLAHREVVDRLVAQADLLVWVADPQKYADAALHAGYLRALVDHQDVVLVVLNQVDLLEADAARDLTDDLVRLLVEDGLDDVDVLTTSALTGAGVPDLRARLVDVVQERGAAARRSRADLLVAAAALRAGVGDDEPDPADVPGADALVDALALAAGVPALVAAVRSSHERAGRARTGWPATRWAARLRPDPLKRLHLGPARSGPERSGPGRPDALDSGEAQAAALVSLARTSLPAPTATQRAGVAAATRQVAASAAHGLPPRWGQAVRDAADGRGTDVTDALDTALTGVALDRSVPRWWAPVALVQALLALAALAGLVWLTALGALTWLGLPRPGSPTVGAAPYAVPLPTVLLVGGVVAGVVLAALARAAVRAAAGRRARAVEADARAAVEGVAADHLLAAVDAVLARHRATREQLDAAVTAAAQRR